MRWYPYLVSRQSQLTLHHPTHHHPHLESGDDTFGVGIPTSPTHSASGPCVPTVVMMCIRHLEIHGLHTVGIFRVSSSKRRVKQVKQDRHNIWAALNAILDKAYRGVVHGRLKGLLQEKQPLPLEWPLEFKMVRIHKSILYVYPLWG